MNRLTYFARRLAIAAPLLAAAPLAAQQPPADSTIARSDTSAVAARDTPRPSSAPNAPDSIRPNGTHDSTAAPAPAPAAPAVNHIETALSNIKLGGYAEGSYAYSTAANGTAISGRLYDRFQNQFALNALKLALDRPAATDKFDAGFHTDVFFGQNASVLKSTGFGIGDQGDITQLFVTLNVPTPNGNGLQLKVGKMVTLMGLEIIEDVANPNWSEGNQFVYVENFTALGASAEYKFNKYVDAQLRLINGWDVVQDNNTGKSVMGRVGLYPDDKSSIGLVGYFGPEEANDNGAKRYGGEVLLNRKLGGKMNVWVQGDIGHEDANAALPDSTRAATWWAAGGWVTYDVLPKLGVALRGDYLDDREGARTSAAFALPPGGPQHKLASGTATLNIRTWDNVLVRPEVRFDRSNLFVFDGDKNQTTFALSVAYSY